MASSLAIASMCVKRLVAGRANGALVEITRRAPPHRAPARVRPPRSAQAARSSMGSSPPRFRVRAVAPRVAPRLGAFPCRAACDQIAVALRHWKKACSTTVIMPGTNMQQVVQLPRNPPGLGVLAGEVSLHDAHRLEMRQHALADTDGLQVAQRGGFVEAVFIEAAAARAVVASHSAKRWRIRTSATIAGVADPLQTAAVPRLASLSVAPSGVPRNMMLVMTSARAVRGMRVITARQAPAHAFAIDARCFRQPGAPRRTQTRPR